MIFTYILLAALFTTSIFLIITVLENKKLHEKIEDLDDSNDSVVRLTLEDCLVKIDLHSRQLLKVPGHKGVRKLLKGKLGHTLAKNVIETYVWLSHISELTEFHVKQLRKGLIGEDEAIKIIQEINPNVKIITWENESYQHDE